MGEPRRVGEGEVPEVVETLSQAFADDPIFRWWIADAGRRKEILPNFFALLVSASLRGEQVWSLDGVSAALWLPPGPEPSEEENASLGAAMAAACGEYAEVGNAISEAIGAAHPHSLPHMYLWFLGARPGFRGQGLGTRLLRAVLDRCDAEGMPAYLEATSEDNRRLYARHGFVDTGQVVVRDSPPLFCMWREAQG